MKLRLRENSIRLRLLRSEIETLRQSEIVSETIRFCGLQSLVYTIKLSSRAKEISAGFDKNEIVILVPERIGRDWLETDLIGLENEQAIAENLSLKILIEKDFVCLDRLFDKDNADAFPRSEINC